jgi:hypothetical protein
MSQSLQDVLSTLFDHWRQVADETVRHLGEEKAALFVHLYNDALAIFGAVFDVYPEEERLHSPVFVEFMGLSRELNSFHALFLCGNYRLVLTQLRFNWERVFRARYADLYAQEHPGAADPPGPTIDDKHEWLMARERWLGWNDCIVPVLAHLFTASDQADIGSHFRPLWERLNRCVHPSGELREKLAAEPTLHVLDAFDQAWAEETHADAVEVFGLIYLAVLSRFPKAVPALLADPHCFKVLPTLRTVLATSEQDVSS